MGDHGLIVGGLGLGHRQFRLDPGRPGRFLAPSCGRVLADGQSPRTTALAMQIQYHQALPLGSPPRLSRRSREIIGSSAIDAPPKFPKRGPGGPTSRLEKIQTALLGRITPPVTLALRASGLGEAKPADRPRLLFEPIHESINNLTPRRRLRARRDYRQRIKRHCQPSPAAPPDIATSMHQSLPPPRRSRPQR
jgi:hypothetical protein